MRRSLPQVPLEPTPTNEPPARCLSIDVNSPGTLDRRGRKGLQEMISPLSSRRCARRRHRSPRRNLVPSMPRLGKDEDTNEQDTSEQDTVATETVTTASQNPAQEFPEETLSFGQFASDAIMTELDVKVVLLEAAEIPNADRIYSLMQSEDPLADELCHKLPLVRLELTKYELRQLTNASRVTQQLPYLCANSGWDAEWEFVCEEDTDLVDVALPLRVLQLDETPTISRLAQRLRRSSSFPRDDDWLPGVMLVLRHLCKIHDLPSF